MGRPALPQQLISTGLPNTVGCLLRLWSYSPGIKPWSPPVNHPAPASAHLKPQMVAKKLFLASEGTGPTGLTEKSKTFLALPLLYVWSRDENTREDLPVNIKTPSAASRMQEARVNFNIISACVFSVASVWLATQYDSRCVRACIRAWLIQRVINGHLGRLSVNKVGGMKIGCTC